MAGFRRNDDAHGPYPPPSPQPQPQPQPQQPYYGGGYTPPYPQQSGSGPQGGYGYGDGGYAGDGYGDHYGDGYADDGYADDGYAEPQPPPQPKLHWKELLTGIIFRPSPTFWTMRDYPMWGTALIVSFLYGLLAVFGLDDVRQSILDTTTSALIPYLLVTGVAMVLGSLLLGTVTHNLARQFGGNGLWAPTAGLAMLIMALTDVPRLALALFMGGGAPLVQILGWATWLGAGALLTMMVSRSHEIAWPKALAASAIQLVAILALVKLGTI